MFVDMDPVIDRFAGDLVELTRVGSDSSFGRRLLAAEPGSSRSP